MAHKHPTFDELVEAMTHRAHSYLLEKGGPGLRTGIWSAMTSAIHWHQQQEKIDKEEAKKAKKK